MGVSVSPTPPPPPHLPNTPRPPARTREGHDDRGCSSANKHGRQQPPSSSSTGARPSDPGHWRHDPRDHVTTTSLRGGTSRPENARGVVTSSPRQQRTTTKLCYLHTTPLNYGRITTPLSQPRYDVTLQYSQHSRPLSHAARPLPFHHDDLKDLISSSRPIDVA